MTNPLPSRVDGNFQQMLNEYNSIPEELWFRNNPCIFDKYLKCLESRYVVFESNGDIIYDSRPDDKLYPQRAELIPRSVEYQRATSNFIGGVIRGNTNYLCTIAKEGDFYRVVWIAKKYFSVNDESY